MYPITRGICCSFKPAYVGEYSVSKVLHSDENNCFGETLSNETGNAIDDTLNSSSREDEEEPNSDRYCMNQCRQLQLQLEQSRLILRKDYHVPIGTLGFLSNYHADEPFGTKMMVPSRMLKKMKATMKSNQHRNTTPLQFNINNCYAGALYVLSHDLLIQTQAFNSVLYTDVHGLTYSTVDCTPGLPRAVISGINGKQLLEFMTHYHQTAFFSTATQKITIVDNVSSPEDPIFQRSWKFS